MYFFYPRKKSQICSSLHHSSLKIIVINTTFLTFYFYDYSQPDRMLTSPRHLIYLQVRVALL